MPTAPHDFAIVIPAADRPRQLAACLESLTALLQRYPYAGKVEVLIAEDSARHESMEHHRSLADACTRRGLETHYLGQQAQRALVEALPQPLYERLAGIIGDGEGFSHKGASITRNIACLWLARLQRDGKNRLFWFVDSDHEFRTEYEDTKNDNGGLVDYFHWLDRIFSETPTRVLTGKITGDPPVSPAVMAVKLLDDVFAFVGELAGRPLGSACSFHGGPNKKADAAYHDMADLFGYQSGADTWRYRCSLQGLHDHAACLAAFAARLNSFFDGEHPTRQVYYQPDDILASLQPARTIYTGNFVADAATLPDCFIPFASLRLRMAGPTLGRIMQAELGERFVSANLPMLHKRTVDATGQSEYRAGIERTDMGVDLSGEFERQYFGDVALFSIEKLARLGFPDMALDEETVIRTVDETENEMQARYRSSREQIQEKTDRLQRLLLGQAHIWQRNAAQASRDFSRFIDDIRANFAGDSPAWRLIGSVERRQARRQAISKAILRYREDRKDWHEAMQ